MNSAEGVSSDWQRAIPHKVINALGTVTTLGGNKMFPSAVRAMSDISTSFVKLDEFSEKAGKYIANRLGVEAALITSGAAAGLTISTAALMTGTDPKLISSLPEPPKKHEIIIQCSHRNPFERALVIAGARLVQVGNAIETHTIEIENAITPQTAGMIYFLQSAMYPSSLTLKETIQVCTRNSIPLIVDAAAELPPKSNLWSIANDGADLVVFSGGKEIRGPQTSGLIIGKEHLIKSSMLQSAPNEYAIARPMKAGKEIIAGITAAIDEYLEEDEVSRFILWDKICDQIMTGLKKTELLVVDRVIPHHPKVQPNCIPRLRIRTKVCGDLPFLYRKLEEGTPAVFVEVRSDHIVINPQTLDIEDAELIVNKINSIMRNRKG